MDKDDEKAAPRTLSFTKAEIESLLKACKKYRATLPAYLQSAAAELRVMDGLIRKLS